MNKIMGVAKIILPNLRHTIILLKPMLMSEVDIKETDNGENGYSIQGGIAKVKDTVACG